MTDGRASQPISADAGSSAWKLVSDLMPATVRDGIVCSVSPNAASNQLEKTLAVQMFGFAASHVSHAKAELHQMSCWRWSLQGTREVALLSYEKAASWLKQQKTRA